MNSGIYLKSIFNVVSDADLINYVRDLDENRADLEQIFEVMPQRATEYSAGYDLACVNDEVIPAHGSRLITFGYSIRLENPTVTAIIVPRSSLAKKKGLILSGGPKYIYSGETHRCITCKFVNYSDQTVELKAGDKIAQVVFVKYPSWVLGDFDALSLENADKDILPDPLDETLMSPQFDNNLESIEAWNNSNEKELPFIDQTARVSYFFQAPNDCVLEPGKVTCIMTGIRCKVGNGQVFLLKNAFYNQCVELANSIGLIDADYYDNPDNGGEIGVLLLNRGNVPIQVRSGDVIASGSIFYYEKADGDVYGGKRVGGFGSTDDK